MMRLSPRKILAQAAAVAVGFAILGGNRVSAQPVIRAIVPDNGASGQGAQIVTIQGFDLIGSGGFPATVVTFTHRTTGVV